MKEIPLYNSNEVTTVDDVDYEPCMEYKWHLGNQKTTKYAYMMVGSPLYYLSMQEFLIGKSEGKLIDHVDSNGLNNQRTTNIRFATPTQNNQNKSMQKTASTVAIRVTKCKGNDKYRSTVWGAPKVFNTLNEAIIDSDNRAIKYFGEFAKLNDQNHPNKIPPTCNLPFVGYMPTGSDDSLLRDMYLSLKLTIESSSLSPINDYIQPARPLENHGFAYLPPSEIETKYTNNKKYDKEKLSI